MALQRASHAEELSLPDILRRLSVDVHGNILVTLFGDRRHEASA